MSKNPSIRIKFHQGHFKVMEIKANAGEEIPAHEVNIPALLHIVKGSLIYKEEKKEINLEAGDFYSIPKDITHALSFTTVSTLYLMLSTHSLIKFKEL